MLFYSSVSKNLKRRQNSLSTYETKSTNKLKTEVMPKATQMGFIELIVDTSALQKVYF